MDLIDVGAVFEAVTNCLSDSQVKTCHQRSTILSRNRISAVLFQKTVILRR
jgi:hypothetical protein